MNGLMGRGWPLGRTFFYFLISPKHVAEPAINRPCRPRARPRLGVNSRAMVRVSLGLSRRARMDLARLRCMHTGAAPGCGLKTPVAKGIEENAFRRAGPFLALPHPRCKYFYALLSSCVICSTPTRVVRGRGGSVTCYSSTVPQ